jgi:membrane-anchored mycosin MYCP
VLADGSHAPFSNTGPWVSIAALGARGTSFAAPLVSATAARLWRANPTLSARRVAAILRETASGHGLRNDALGYGILDPAAALAQAFPGK